MIRKLLIRLLLGRKKDGFCDIVFLGGKAYLVSIRVHEPAAEFIGRMEKALQEQGMNS